QRPRVAVMMPPRHGKSQYVSHWLPVWFLENFPDRSIILCSYAASFAMKWGRAVRNSIVENADVLTVRISADSKAADRWSTTAGGGMLCAGVGGPITGQNADLFILDDPVKNA